MLEKPTAVQAALVLSGSNGALLLSTELCCSLSCACTLSPPTPATDNELNLENPDQFMHQKARTRPRPRAELGRLCER